MRSTTPHAASSRRPILMVSVWRAPVCHSTGRVLIEEVQVAFDTILFDKHAGVATVTMNRPERLNAMTWHMIEEFLDAIEDCRQDESVRVIVFTGAGPA